MSLNRIIIDTNLFISFLLNKDFSKLDKIINNNEVKLIFSEELLSELVEVISRDKFKKYFSKKDKDLLLEKLKIRSNFVKSNTRVDLCRDKKDNFLLSLAIDSKATHLITGDKDLLILDKIEKTKIIPEIIRFEIS